MAPMMRDSQYLSPISQLDVHHVIRKPRNAYAPDREIRDARHRRTNVVRISDATHCRVDGTQEIGAKTGSAALIPARCFGDLGLSVRADSKATCQRLFRSRSRRFRTSGHGRPGSSPDRALTARRSISSAHAASASSSAAASRLAISSDASSARSPGSSFRASLRSFEAAFVTTGNVAREWSPNKPYLERTGDGAVYSYRIGAGRSAPIR